MKNTVSIAVACVTFAAAAAAAAGQAGSGQSRDSEALEEVVVTAQKRTERLQDVPVPITALATESMVQQGRTQLEDYFASVPGLTVDTQGVGRRQVILRGLSTESLANTTVAASIDDVPFGSSTLYGRGSDSYPNIDPSDLARIEVLRGPQGTMYGASSIGGVLKFVTQDPSTEQFSGQVQLSSSVIDHGGTGYGASGSVNVPVSDAFALRITGFTRRDPGYITNVLTGARRIDEADSRGGRVSALWQISDAVSLKLGGMYQNDKGDGDAAHRTDLGEFENAVQPGTGAYDFDTQFYSAVLTADLGRMDLTSVTGYTKSAGVDILDFTETVVAFFGPGGFYGDYGVQAGTMPEDYRTSRVTQELRLSSKPGGRIEWLGGLFFNSERSPSRSAYTSNDPVTGEFIEDLVVYQPVAKLKEYSAFANVTFHLTDRFDVQVGAREAKIQQSYEETDTSFVPELNLVIPVTKTDANAFTYLLTPRFKFNDDFMAYARFASGYRVGGPNIVQPGLSIPARFNPDKTYSYELGTKGTLPGGVFSFDASVFYIEWKNVQVALSDPTGGFFWRDNVGGARSQGLEISTQARPAEGMTAELALGYTDAVLTADLPPGQNGRSGDRLPTSARFTGAFSLSQEFPLAGSFSGSVGGTISHVGRRVAGFTAVGLPRVFLPSYVSYDVRAGASNDAWSIDLYLNNLTDKRGLIGGGQSPSGAATTVRYIQPRTLGLSLTRMF